MAHYSYSKLSVFSCPFRFHQKYNLKKKEPESDLLIIGRICHDIIYDYSNHLISSKQNTDFTLIPEMIDNRLAENRRYDLADEITNIITRFSAGFMVHDTIFDVEHKFGLDRNLIPIGWPKHPAEWDFVFFVGIIDRVDLLNREHVKITDYKSGWNTDVDKFQMQLYALALSHIFPDAQRFTIELDFIRFGIQKSFEIDKVAIDKIRENLFQLVEEIESTTQWEPHPGDACKWCGFLDSCPAMKRALHDPVDGNILIEDQARKTAEDLLLVGARLDMLRGALQSWVKTEGPVIHNGFNFGYHLKETDEIERIAELIRKLEDIADLDKYFTVSAADRKKLQKDYPDLYEDYRIIKKSTRWAIAKENTNEG